MFDHIDVNINFKYMCILNLMKAAVDIRNIDVNAKTVIRDESSATDRDNLLFCCM